MTLSGCSVRVAACDPTFGVLRFAARVDLRPDQKLLRLIEDPSAALAATDRPKIVQHIAAATFSADNRTVEAWQLIGPTVVGRPHPSKPGETLTAETSLNSAEWHAAKHSATGEWAADTSTAEYLDDLRAAVRHPTSVMHVGRDSIPCGARGARRMASRVGLRTPMEQARSLLKKAVVLADHELLAIYDPVRRCLNTVYRLGPGKAVARVVKWVNHREFPP